MMFSTDGRARSGSSRDGKVRALAVTGAKRSQLFPDLPTVAEAGLPGYEAVLHYGIVAPAGTPRPIVEKLNAALQRGARRRDDVTAAARGRRRRAAAVDARRNMPPTSTQEEAKWSEIIRKAGVKGE